MNNHEIAKRLRWIAEGISAHNMRKNVLALADELERGEQAGTVADPRSSGDAGDGLPPPSTDVRTMLLDIFARLHEWCGLSWTRDSVHRHEWLHDKMLDLADEISAGLSVRGQDEDTPGIKPREEGSSPSPATSTLPPELVLTEEEREHCQRFVDGCSDWRGHRDLAMRAVLLRLIAAQPKDGE